MEELTIRYYLNCSVIQPLFSLLFSCSFGTMRTAFGLRVGIEKYPLPSSQPVAALAAPGNAPRPTLGPEAPRHSASVLTAPSPVVDPGDRPRIGRGGRNGDSGDRRETEARASDGAGRIPPERRAAACRSCPAAVKSAAPTPPPLVDGVHRWPEPFTCLARRSVSR